MDTKDRTITFAVYMLHNDNISYMSNWWKSKLVQTIKED